MIDFHGPIHGLGITASAPFRFFDFMRKEFSLKLEEWPLAQGVSWPIAGQCNLMKAKPAPAPA
jgi:hypothetical protein